MRTNIGTLFCAHLFLGLFIATVIDQTVSGEEAFVSQTCSTSKCHTDIKSRAFKHSPLEATNSCSICHQKGEGEANLPKDHPSLAPIVKSKMAQTCKSCHDSWADPTREKRYAHERVNPKIDKGCASCHDSHGSQTKFILKNGGAPELCWTCHEDRRKIHIHSMTNIARTDRAKRVRLKDDKIYCLTCHHPHSPSPEKEKVQWFCASCHGEEAIQVYENFHKLLGRNKKKSK